VKRTFIGLTALVAILALCQPADASPSWWHAPRCGTVTGNGAVTFTRDDGATLAPTTGHTRPVQYTYGLTALDTPNTLLATVNGTLERSTDAGCTWAPIGPLASRFFMRLAPARGGSAYAWQDNGTALQRVHGDRLETLTVPKGIDGVSGLGVDRRNGDHVRLGDGAGQIWDSRDGGHTWTALGRPAYTDNLFVYRTAFDPNDLDHVVTGWLNHGGAVSVDGGRHWHASTGLAGDGKGNVNLFSVTVSPAAGFVVYAEGLDMDEYDQGTPTEGRHVYVSLDGGRQFRPIATNNIDDIHLINGNLLAPHPTNPFVLYFEFGMSYGGYGTDLYRYDLLRGRITRTHNDNDGFSSIAYNPADPRVMYVGITDEP
jgi:hypothetical protein